MDTQIGQTVLQVPNQVRSHPFPESGHVFAIVCICMAGCNSRKFLYEVQNQSLKTTPGHGPSLQQGSCPKLQLLAIAKQQGAAGQTTVINLHVHPFEHCPVFWNSISSFFVEDQSELYGIAESCTGRPKVEERTVKQQRSDSRPVADNSFSSL